MDPAADTIAAVATAAGTGGVGIVRVSGPTAIAIVGDVIAVTDLDRRVRVASARGKDGVRIDQVLAFAMRGPASFTGEDVAELQGHGGAHNLRRLLAAVIDRGARLAEPGEFTRRAVLNGKLDLLRAEALLEVIQAGSERGLRLAQANLGGQLGEVVGGLERRGLAVLADLEGRIDFPDDDLEAQDERAIDSELDALAARCGGLADGFRHGHAIGHGVSVALVGAVNVGKSSLLNALVGTERAVVAPDPGTTRDFLEVTTIWEGVSVTLVDTAGARETVDPVEARGIELGARRVATADVVIVVNDETGRWDDGARFGARALVIRSKADLGGDSRGALATSATAGTGLAELKRRVLSLAGVAELEGNESELVTTARQQANAAAARDGFVAALAARQSRKVIEVVALEVRRGVQALAELRGVAVGERVLDEVFSRFCIGK